MRIRNAKTLPWRPGFLRDVVRRGMIVAVAGLVMTVSAAVAQDRPGLLDRIGALFGGAVEVEELELAVDFGAVADQATPAEIATRQKRLDAWCLALEESLVESLSLTEDQRVELRKLLTKESALNQQRWKKRQNQQTPLPDTTVILFTGRSGPTSRLHRAVTKAVPKLLAEEQQGHYSELITQRNQRIANWFARRATVVIDEELFLNEEQRTACFEQIRQRTIRRSDGLYAFHQQRYYLPYVSPRKLILKNTDFQLTPVQKRRWSDLSGNDSDRNNNVTVFIGAGANGENDKQLDAAYNKAKQRFLNVAAVRAEYLATSLELPEKQARYLEVAGKGATIRCLKEWKDRTQKQIKQFANNQQFVGRQQIGLSGPDVRGFDRDKLWNSAVRKVISKTDTDVQRRREEHILEGAVAFVMATLDRELLLNHDQVEGLRRLVEETEPHRVNSQQYYMLELAMLARTLIRIDNEQLAEVLHESQMECWKQMKSLFQFQDKTNATIATQHGQTTLMLTAPNEHRRNAVGAGFF